MMEKTLFILIQENGYSGYRDLIEDMVRFLRTEACYSYNNHKQNYEGKKCECRWKSDWCQNTVTRREALIFIEDFLNVEEQVAEKYLDRLMELGWLKKHSCSFNEYSCEYYYLKRYGDGIKEKEVLICFPPEVTAIDIDLPEPSISTEL